jgi:flagellar basal body-associated protein FliL
MKFILFIAVALTGSFSFAGGSSTGATGLDSQSQYTMSSEVEHRTNLEDGTPTQVILMDADQSEVVYGATDDGVRTRSLRQHVRDIQPEVQDALRQSAQSGQWESVNTNRAKLNQMKRGDMMRQLSQPSGY